MLRELVDQLNAERSEGGEALQAERARLERERRQVERRVANFVGYIAEGNASAAVARALAEAERELASLGVQLGDLEREETAARPVVVTEDELVALVEEAIRNMWLVR